MKKQKVFRFKKGEDYSSEDIDEFIENNITDFVNENRIWVITENFKVKVILESKK